MWNSFNHFAGQVLCQLLPVQLYALACPHVWSWHIHLFLRYAILVEAIGFTASDNGDFSSCAPAKKRLEAKEAPA
jgi:hypothetical protein